MTRSGQVNKELRNKASIAYADRVSQEEIARKERNLKRWQSKVKSETDLKVGKMKMGGQLGGAVIKALGGLTGNDPEWYKNYIKDLEQFVRIPTFDRVGTTRFGHLYGYSGRDDVGLSVPGIMVFDWMPTCGPQVNGSTYYRNPVNQTLAQAKERVLALNSRSNVSWEPADLGFNLFCSSSIAELIVELGRVIRIYHTYSGKNEYLAKRLIEAAGFTYSDIVAHYAEYRKQYTLLARKFNSAIVAPTSATLFKRRLFLASNVFIDTDDTVNPRQMYLYKVRGVLKLADTAEFCNCQLTDALRASLSQYCALVYGLIESITSDTGFNEMYQDLRHAFGSDIVQLPELVDNDDVVFNFEPLNREQIHNLMIAPILYGDQPTLTNVNGFDLCQDTNGYLYQGKSSGDWQDRIIPYDFAITAVADRNAMANALNKHFSAESGVQIMNMHKDDVSGDDIIDITRGRFTFATHYSSTNKPELLIYDCGTEVVVNSEILYFEKDIATGTVTESYCAFSSYVYAPTGDTSLCLMEAFRSAFDWAPITQVFLGDTGDSESCLITFMDAYTTFTMTAKEIREVHLPCVMSELYFAESNFITKI